MHDYRVKLHNPYSRSRSESQNIITMAKAGHTMDEMAAKVTDSPHDGRLIVEYILGKRELQDIAHLIVPYKPATVELVRPVDEGYLCEAKGDYPEASFEVFVEVPQVSTEGLREVLEKHGEEVAFIAYRNAHERSPAEYEPKKMAKSKIVYEDLMHLLP